MTHTHDSLDGATTGGSAGTSTAAGKLSTTSRLGARPQVVFRVESAEAAAVFADRFGPRDGNGVAAGASDVVARAASGTGAPLPAIARQKFESSLGADLSSVRVHTGAASADAAGAVGARAYTTGNDIHFGAGQYAPDDPFGLHLLAHEVAHTQQQAGGPTSTQYKLEVSSPGDAAEVEADRAADAMVSGAPAAVAFGAGVQRTLMRDKAYEPTFGTKSGGANALEGAGAKAGMSATGADGMVKPVTVSTDWATKRAAQLTTRAGELAHTEFVGDTGKAGTENPGYKILVGEAAEYTVDVVRLGMAETAYNQFVEPANVATIATKQLRGAVSAAGFKDELAVADPDMAGPPQKSITSLGDDLKPAQKDELAKMVGNVANVSDAKTTISSEKGKEEKTTLQAITEEIAGAQETMSTSKSKVVTASKAVRSAVLHEMEKRQKGVADASGEEREKVLTEIKAIADAAKNFTKMIETVASIGIGSAGALEGFAYDAGAAQVDSVKSAVTSPSGLVGDIAGYIATEHYDAKLKKLGAEVDAANGSVAALSAFDIKIQDDVKKETLETQVRELSTATKAWATLVKKRREFLIVKSKEGDAKTAAGKQGAEGDKLSQIAVLLNDAEDAKITIQLGKESATQSAKDVRDQADGVNGHRAKEVPIITAGTGDSDKKSYQLVEQLVGPDHAQLADMEQTIAGWSALATKDADFADKVVRAIGAAGPKK